METRIVALSGHIAAGKTSACEKLREKHAAVWHLSTGDLVREYLDRRASRARAQAAGRNLDEETEGRWVAEAVAERLRAPEADGHDILLVDCVRIDEQLTGLRDAFSSSAVIHVHFSASESERRKRFAKRKRRLDSNITFEEASADPTELSVADLESKADLRIDTSKTSAADCAVVIGSHLGLYGQHATPLVDVLVGGQYGSEGKGHVAHYLSKEYGLLVRVGGPNAGHTVYERPRRYVHHHLPCGTRNSSAKLLLGAGSCLFVESLLSEINQCEVTPERLAIDPQAMIVDPADRVAEQKKLVSRVASTAQGVGYATARKVLRGDMKSVVLARDVPQLKPYLRDSTSVLEEAISNGDKVFLEGTQGTGLSLHHGIYPYVTSRETSASGCLAEAGISPRYVRRIIMICRTYPIRVGGNSGDLANEISWSEVARRSGLDAVALRKAERTSTTNRRRRVGEFDWAMFRKAVSINGPTDIALTFADYLCKDNELARRFEQLSTGTLSFIEGLERVARAPVSLITTRFHYRSIIDRRAWS